MQRARIEGVACDQCLKQSRAETAHCGIAQSLRELDAQRSEGWNPLLAAGSCTAWQRRYPLGQRERSVGETKGGSQRHSRRFTNFHRA
jgi:hypothetical protein